MTNKIEDYIKLAEAANEGEDDYRNGFAYRNGYEEGYDCGAKDAYRFMVESSPPSAKDETVDLVKLENAIDELQDFDWDSIGVLRNIIHLKSPKCECNASICDFCIAQNTYDDAKKYFPTILQAARLWLQSQKGPCLHTRVDHNLECLDCDEPVYASMMKEIE